MSSYETKPDSIVFTAGCAPLCHYYNYDKITCLECGNKIIMPQRMLDRLSKYENLTYPLTFEIIADKNKYICGVYEFVAGIDHIYVPHFIYDKIQCDIAAIRYIDTPFKNGTKVIVQPHTSNFLDIENHKVFLEQYINNYTVLQKNTTIMLPNHNSPISSNIYLNIIETEPTDIISIVDTDIEIDFRPPLDYKEPEPETQTFTANYSPEYYANLAENTEYVSKNDDDVKYYNHDFIKQKHKRKKSFESFSGKGSRLGGD